MKVTKSIHETSNKQRQKRLPQLIASYHQQKIYGREGNPNSDVKETGSKFNSPTNATSDHENLESYAPNDLKQISNSINSTHFNNNCHISSTSPLNPKKATSSSPKKIEHHQVLLDKDLSYEHLFEDFGDLLAQSRQTLSNFNTSSQSSQVQNDFDKEQFDEEVHSIWDNDLLLIRGFDCENWKDSKGHDLSIFQLYKCRSGTFPNQRENLKNSDVIRLLQRFARKCPNSVKIDPSSFVDTSNYEDDNSIEQEATYKQFKAFHEINSFNRQKKADSRLNFPILQNLDTNNILSDNVFNFNTPPNNAKFEILDSNKTDHIEKSHSPVSEFNSILEDLTLNSKTKEQNRQMQLYFLQDEKRGQDKNNLQSSYQKKRVLPHLNQLINHSSFTSPSRKSSTHYNQNQNHFTINNVEQQIPGNLSFETYSVRTKGKTNQNNRCNSEVTSPRRIKHQTRSEIKPPNGTLNQKEIFFDHQCQSNPFVGSASIDYSLHRRSIIQQSLQSTTLHQDENLKIKRIKRLTVSSLAQSVIPFSASNSIDKNSNVQMRRKSQRYNINRQYIRSDKNNITISPPRIGNDENIQRYPQIQNKQWKQRHYDGGNSSGSKQIDNQKNIGIQSHFYSSLNDSKEMYLQQTENLQNYPVEGLSVLTTAQIIVPQHLPSIPSRIQCLNRNQCLSKSPPKQLIFKNTSKYQNQLQVGPSRISSNLNQETFNTIK